LLLCHHYFIILLCVNNIIRDVSCCFFSSFHCYHYGIICRYFTFLFYKLINKRHNLRQFIILFVINNALRYQMVVFDVICCCFRLFDGISGCFDGVSGCLLIWLSVHLSVQVCMSVRVSFHTLIQALNADTISNQFNSIFFIELIEIIFHSLSFVCEFLIISFLINISFHFILSFHFVIHCFDEIFVFTLFWRQYHKIILCCIWHFSFFSFILNSI
jgi:hypothetical protein